MDAPELQAKVTIAAAPIAARVVEIPRLPEDTGGAPDPAADRLRQLTDHIYDVLTDPARG